ncbi:MAG TPA: twin-arginine translocase TatA/TatE family subunit [Candidatus Solibacter sp.]|nr:twin-arginine translocase TatA/TatE family subunit [Candidatus Solibacter sp.]
MLSMTHMIVVFIVVLVVFGPQKLPELARGLGKLMAEFRKASTDFKSAFEQEMRDIERQALQAERKKAAEAAATSAAAAQAPATLASLPGTGPTTDGLDAESRVTEALVVTPVAESIPRSNGAPGGTAESAPAGSVAEPPVEPITNVVTKPVVESAAEPVAGAPQTLSHDQQQPV